MESDALSFFWGPAIFGVWGRKSLVSNFQLLSAAATLVSPKSKFNIRPFFLAFFPLFYRHLWSATVSRYFEISTGQISIKWNAKECWKLVEIDVRSIVSFARKIQPRCGTKTNSIWLWIFPQWSSILLFCTAALLSVSLSASIDDLLSSLIGPSHLEAETYK